MATDISAVTNFNTFEAASKILLIIIQHINTAPCVCNILPTIVRSTNVHSWR